MGANNLSLESLNLKRRLTWLLVFRASVASALLVFTIAADVLDWPISRISTLLYAVVIGTYAIIAVLGALLRSGSNAIALAAAHLVSAVLLPVMVVQATGGIDSPFSFLYLLAILDGAIIQGKSVAFATAIATAILYGLQLALQMYEIIIPVGHRTYPPVEYITSALTHMASFFTLAFLSGYLADQIQQAQRFVSNAQHNLQKMEGQLRQKERLAHIGELAAAIAHELRNPLAAISGSVQLLQEKTTDAATRERLQGIILHEIDRLNGLVQDFLSYARPAPPERIPTDLGALLQDVATMIQRDKLWEHHPIQLTLANKTQANVDSGQIRQVLWNLLRNAAEASHPGSAVEVKLSNSGDGFVEISIRDFGKGLDPKIRTRLFEPFQTTKTGGSGLGLAIVHRIVESHLGTIHLDDAPGGGTCARVKIPQA